jgi:hypothetical protein
LTGRGGEAGREEEWEGVEGKLWESWEVSSV